MGCPVVVQPHQIQGLDYARLFPVIQWLVKIVLQFQEENAEFTRKQATIQFNKISESSRPSSIRDLNHLFLPKRKFKTISTRKLNDPIRVYAALLEFGDATAGSSYQKYVNMTKEVETVDKFGRKKNVENKDFIEISDKAEVSFDKIAEKIGDKKKENEEGDEENLLEQETEKVELRKSTTVMWKNVAKIAKSEDISIARNQYLDIKKEENPEIMQKRLEKEREERQILTLSKEIELNTETLQKLQTTVASLRSEVQESSEVFEKEKDLNDRIKETIQNLEENTQESKKVLQANLAITLEQLVLKRNSLKEAQKIFKEKCNKEIEDLNKKTEQEVESDVQEWFQKIDKSYDEILKKYQRARGILAEKNREVAVLQRKLESKPSQTELTQFQRRFVELYEQINLKVEENRRFYASYNALIEVRNLLESEISTLDSFKQGFTQSKKKSEKESFAENVTGAISQVVGKTKKAQEKQRALAENLKELEKKYKSLEEIERSYYQMVKEFNDLIGN
jgi:hypothetical protein